MHRMNYLLLTCLLLITSISHAAEWGDLTATFVYDGKAPAPVKARVDKDVAFCGKFNLVDESLVVNQKNGGVANILSYIYVSRSGKKPAVHPDYAKTASSDVTVDNGKCRFEPHVTVLRTSQTLLVTNTDTVGHNTNITTLSNPGQNILVPANGELKLKFPAEERVPVSVACNIHPWMTGWVVMKEHPYVATTDKDGKLSIKNIPVGTWTFQFWHERPGYVTDVTIGGKKASWRRGRVELTIKAGKNDLGDIKLAPSVFVEK
ncbi:MAG: hypothetical protein QGG71_12110 [Pirellulaceae bacterium]|nr:hypothetical protein [Pirellulaceae bacterium]